MSDQVMMQKPQLTQEGYDEIVKELKELEEVKLPDVIKRVEAARQYGDLSENAEYSNAKEDQEFTETRISDLKAVLQNATIVKHTTKKSAVGMGSKVIVKIASGRSKKQSTLHIVGEFEAEPRKGKISSASPLGKALMGKKKGDEVKVEAPAGVITYQIIEIE